MASCLGGTHAIWWTVEAASERGALEFLLSYVADRTPATRVREVTSHEPRRHARHDPVRSLSYRRQGRPYGSTGRSSARLGDTWRRP